MNHLYELGSDSNRQFYGLFDTEHNFFYRVHFNKLAMDYLFDLIKNVKSVAVLPLHQCVNWHHNIIDNTNCTQWGIDAFCSELRSKSLIGNHSCLIEKNIHIDSNLQLLIDNLEYVLKIIFYTLPAKSKQNFEYAAPKKIQVLFADDEWVTQAIQYELDYVEQYKNLYDQHITEIKLIPKNFLIEQDNYQDLVAQQIKHYCLQVNAKFFMNLTYV
jgi:hypothetical protein